MRGYKIATPIPNICSAYTKEYRIATIFLDGRLSKWSNAKIFPNTINSPSNLEATVSEDPLQVKLTWKDMSNNEIGFRIYRWEGLGIGPWIESLGKEWPLLATVDANEETFIDTDVKRGYTFKYIIKAFNDIDISPPPKGVMVYIPILGEVPSHPTNNPPNILFANKKSPCELCIYDSQDRVTGIVNGEVREEIPGSIYDTQNKIAVIFSSSDSYLYKVVGTETGAYGLDITSVEDGEVTTFTATNIPTSANTIHQYAIDWDALPQGTTGVTFQVDSNGDGLFEQGTTTGNTFTEEEFGSLPFPEVGTLSIISMPSGAEIYIDDVKMAQVTPATLTYISAGTHTVALNLYGYQGWADVVTIISSETTKLEVTLTPSAALNLINIIAYPNPCKGYDKVTFKNLTDQCKISIYNIAGELIFEQEFTNTQGKAEWNLKNISGNDVASGVYIYVVTNNQKQKAIGKIGIIR